MKIQPYLVVFNLPEKLRPLHDLAMNLWSCWNWDAVELFIRLDPEEWERSNSNPVLMLGRLSLEKLEAAAADAEFVARLNAVHAKLKDYLARETWFAKSRPAEKGALIAYFSMEFGIDEGIPIYSGGLGILAGDHLKSSSDLGVPLVGVGLLYQKGYFQQYLSRDGWQQERYPENDWFNMPVTLERGPDGRPVTIEVELEEQKVRAQVWKVQVGRVPLYLLDTNVPENSPEVRAITANLYGGDRETRIRQELILGVGGVRALEALGLKPTVFHMNEGHSAFLALERLRVLISGGMSFEQARELIFASTVFTTHTPVPAGHESFEPALIQKYFAKRAAELGFKWEDVFALGQEEPGKSPEFSMTVLALRMAGFCNGVSKLHGEVSRAMFKHLWPGLPAHEAPITHITNGVHTRSWISHDLGSLLEKHAGAAVEDHPEDQRFWSKVRDIPPQELWALRRLRKQKLVSVVRRRLQAQLKEQGADATQVKAAGKILDPETLTIGFARRFAAYKRAALILRDPQRLTRLLNQPERPVQIIFAGKSHPHDAPGKELIKALFHYTQDPKVRDKVVFLEDYDIRLARYLVQGVDVWLNNPRRPLEASGTSGMKAAANGALNVSTLDGWWDEGYDPSLGWAIGAGETYGESSEGDYIESEALYNLLEQEVVPLYYRRDAEDLPQEWIEMIKASMAKLGSFFNTHRMLVEYADRGYLPSHRAGRALWAEGAAPAKALAEWRKKVARSWPKVQLTGLRERADAELKAGDRLPITVLAKLDGLSPDDVAVEIYYGPLNAQGEIERGEVLAMAADGRAGDEHRFKAEVPCRVSGRHGYAIRARPKHPSLIQPYTPFNLAWE